MNFCKSYHSCSTFGKWAKYFRQRVKSYFKACLLIITTTEIIFPITLEGHLNFLVCIDFLSSFFLSCSFHCFQFFINVFAHLFILAIEIFFAMSSCWPQGLRVVRKHLPPVPRDKRMKTSSQLRPKTNATTFPYTTPTLNLFLDI